MKKYWDSVEVGDSLIVKERPPISRQQIAQYAAATEDFSPLQTDEEFAKNAGFGSVFASGLFSLGFTQEAIETFANNMKIVSLNGTFQRLIWPGDRLSPKGMVLRRYVKNDEHRIVFRIWCENQNSEIVMRGNCTCLLFKNFDAEQQSPKSIPACSSTTVETLNKRCKEIIARSKMAKAPQPVGV